MGINIGSEKSKAKSINQNKKNGMQKSLNSGSLPKEGIYNAIYSSQYK